MTSEILLQARAQTRATLRKERLTVAMRKAASMVKPPSLQPPVPVRSPRTSIILAELARQRRFERRQRRLKRQERRRAWARLAAWLGRLGHGVATAIWRAPRQSSHGGHGDPRRAEGD